MATETQARERVVALYDYHAKRTVEISFCKGDVIEIVSKDGPWWVGELRGVKGKLPSNFVTPEKAAGAQQAPMPARPRNSQSLSGSDSAAATAAAVAPPAPAPSPVPGGISPAQQHQLAAQQQAAERAAALERAQAQERAAVQAAQAAERAAAAERAVAAERAAAQAERAAASSPASATPSPGPAEMMVPTTCIANYTYTAQRDCELSFNTGDLIQIVSNKGKWWDGELHGRRGKFPSNYVVVVPPDTSPVDIPPPPGPPPPVPVITSMGSPRNSENPLRPTTDGMGRRGSVAPSASPFSGRSVPVSLPPGITGGRAALCASAGAGFDIPPPGLPPPSSGAGGFRVVPLSQAGATSSPMIGGGSPLMGHISADNDKQPSFRLSARERGATFGGAEDPLTPGIARTESTLARDEAFDGYMRIMKYNAGYVDLPENALVGTGTIRGADVDMLMGSSSSDKYPFLEPDGPTNIRVEKNEIIAATLPKIIEKLTDRILPGAAFVQAFLLSYRGYTDASTMFELLKLRYNTPPNLPDDHQESIQIRVWYFLREWITNHFYDWADEPELFQKLEQFVDQMCQNHRESVSSAAQQLKKLIATKGQAGQHTRVTGVAPPKPFWPSCEVRTVLDINPVEAARQLALMEFDIFSKIKPKECFNLAWTKRDATKRSPNIVNFIRNFNKVNGWVMATVLNCKLPAQRTEILKHMLKIAEACKEIQNYNSMMEIVAALANAAVLRLKKSWNSKLEARYKVLEGYMEKNFKATRELLSSASPPCVPYIGLYFTDLVFIDEGNPNFLKDAPNMVNWAKAQMTANIMQNIQRFQAKGYNFSPCGPVSVFITHGIERESITEKAAYDLSLQVEPRGH